MATPGETAMEPPGPQYPDHWEADVVLADGGVAHIRPVRPDDTEALREMHRRMSDRSKYLRYFSAVGEVSDNQLKVFTDVDYRDSVALLAELGGQVLAAGTYHLDQRTGGAEVAFAVQDDQQGRGLGSILLEHLAAAAQENHIRKFTAEVLSENQQMMRVFIDAGYQVRREYSSGVIDLEFDIAPTEASRAVSVSREQRAESRSIARLLRPRSIAVIGASNEPTKLGHAVLSNLLASFTGPVYPVNPEAVAVQGVRAYSSVMDIPDPVDAAVVTVPAHTVAEVVEACRAKGVHGLIVMSAGFAESATDGARDAQRQMVAVVRGNGMRLLGPNCLGMVNTDPEVRMNATLAPVVPPAGRVGFFCQSGALGIAVLADAAARGLGLSSFVSAGNRADVSGNDLMQFWQTDQRTEVVLLYLESFGNPRKFARLARALARVKPVIAVKSGRHAFVTPGLASSSAQLSDAAVATVFEQAGVIRTDNLASAFDVAQLLANQPLPTSGSVAVLGNSTALGVLVHDACLDAGLQVAGDAPVDLGVNVSPQELADAVRAAISGGEAGAVIVVYVPPVAVPGWAHAEALRQAAQDSPIPVMTTFLAVDGLDSRLMVDDAEHGAARGSVPSYRTPERAVAALAAAVRYAGWRARPEGTVSIPPECDVHAAAALVTGWVSDADAGVGGIAATDRQVSMVFDTLGMPIVDFEVAASDEQAVQAAERLGYPVVLKTFDDHDRDSLQGGGVRGSLASADQVRAAYQVLTTLSGPQVYVQKMASVGRDSVSTVFSITLDPSFGALLSFGIGGLATDLLADRSYRAVPLTDVDASDLIDAPRAAPLLSGYLGRTPVDRARLVDVALRLSAFADAVPEVLAGAVRVLAGSQGIAVLGGRLTIGRAPTREDVRRRMR